MRRLLVALALLASVTGASAGDFELPDLSPLRGSTPYVPAAPTFTRWSGFYAGGQLGYGNSSFDFSGATQPLFAFMLRELALENEQHPSTWKVLGKADHTGTSGGGF